MMDDSKQIILALGSNSEQTIGMGKAKTLLMALLGDVRFSKTIWTSPIGIQSDNFLNCMAKANTSMSFSRLNAALKKIEHLCGDTSPNRKENVIKMDIDILQYGTEIRHEKDWSRPYIIELLNELNEE